MCGEKADLKDKKGVGETYGEVLAVAEEEVMVPRIRMLVVGMGRAQSI